jgi:SprT protein
MSNYSQSKILGPLNEQQIKHKLMLMDALRKYVPDAALEMCCELVMYYKLNLHIEVERKGRYGDYHPTMGGGNRITVNHNLNHYEFLITFIHELAHHTTYLKFGNKVDHHGKEWKAEFKQNMMPFLTDEIFPNDIKFALIGHMRNPKYSHSADVKLLKVLMGYDKTKNYTTLDEIREGALFKMPGKSKIILKKLDTLRTFTNCLAVATGRRYQVHTLAKIIPLTQDGKPIEPKNL